MAKKPNYRVTAKSKATGKFQDIAAFWIGDRGISGQLDKSVEKIVLSNGAVIRPDSCWFNLQEVKDNPSAASQDSGGYEHEEGGADGSDIPF